ncbi:MAG: flagellar basal body rod protein FlgC [Alphaproteobacteria bacterium]
MTIAYITRPPKSQSPLYETKKILEQGMNNNALRARIAAENFSNAMVTSNTPGGDPYTRKTVTFQEQVDRKTSVNLLKLHKIGKDNAPFRIIHKPFHPAADEKGYVKMPNVEPAIEMVDFNQSNYESSLGAQLYSLSTTMDLRNHDLMRR